MPEKLVQPMTRLIELVALQRFCYVSNRPIQPATNPPVGKTELVKLRGLTEFSDIEISEIHEDKARGIPNFICEVAVPFRPRLGEFQITSWHREGRQREPESVRPETFNQVKRVHHVASRL